jgi:hypothetical protein
MEPLLKNALLKVERAQKHIHDLNIEIYRFLDSHHHTAFIEHDSNCPGDLLKVRQNFDTPSEISLVLGDVIHNLHSALDIAINEVEALTCGVMTPYTKFPIYESREKFEAAINGGFQQKVPFEILNLLQVDVQPYHGGYGEALFYLHSLDIEDKHRTILTTTVLTFVSGICIQLDNGTEVNIGDWLIVPNQVAENCINGNRDVKVIKQGQPAFHMEFSRGLPLGGHTVLPTCIQLAHYVTGVIQQLDHIMNVWMEYRDLRT